MKPKRVIPLLQVALLVFLGCVALFRVPQALANPVFGQQLTLKQPDGTVLKCLVWGDEYHRRVEMPNGFTIVPNRDTGWYEYARLEGSQLVPSGFMAGYADPAELTQAGLTPHTTDRPAVVRKTFARRMELQSLVAETGTPRLKAPLAASGPFKGPYKNLVICVDFQPEASSPVGGSHIYGTPVFNSAIYSTTGASMVTYYKENSYGYFTPQGGTYPAWVVLPHTATYYEAHNTFYHNAWSDIISDAMDVIHQQNPTFNFTAYANSGELSVFIIWAGKTEGWSDFYWPHSYMVNISKYGVRATNYLAINERNDDDTANTDIGVFCHEYCHMLGGPDLYDYSSFQNLPNGYYCLMSCGSARTHICGFVKWKYFNWVVPRELKTDGTYNVLALASKKTRSPKLFRAKINGSNTEYFLVENRLDGISKFETLQAYRDSGVQITHVDESMWSDPFFVNWGYPDFKFYGVEALVPTLSTTITSLDQFGKYFGHMTFSEDLGRTRVAPTFPVRRPPGKFLTLTSEDDTEHVIFPNTQGHEAVSLIEFTNIGSKGETVSFDYHHGS